LRRKIEERIIRSKRVEIYANAEEVRLRTGTDGNQRGVINLESQRPSMRNEKPPVPRNFLGTLFSN
jgi:hypothetical protein